MLTAPYSMVGVLKNQLPLNAYLISLLDRLKLSNYFLLRIPAETALGRLIVPQCDLERGYNSKFF